MEPTDQHDEDAGGDLASVVLLGLRLGTTSFGGPAAHIAMLRNEVVRNQAWVSEEEFLDLLGASNLIPGPTSSEMVMHVGMTRAGTPGLVFGGLAFLLPAAFISGGLAWLYQQSGNLPAFDHVLYGIKPVVIAVIIQAVWGLGKTALKGWWTAGLAAVALALAFTPVSDILILLGCGVVAALARGVIQRRGRTFGIAGAWIAGLMPLAAATGVPYSSWQLFWSFLKIGATLFGSGYVLFAFMQQEFVDRLGWLSQQELLDAIAVGQFTPGPVFSSATFAGYLMGGWGGAALATVAIFLPAFVLVAITHRHVGALRSNPWSSGFLTGVNAAAVALMASVLVATGRDGIVDAPTLLLALGASVLLIRWRVNSALLIVTGAAIGLLLGWLA